MYQCMGGWYTCCCPDSVPDYTVVHPPCQSISDSQVDRPPSSLNDGDGGGDDYDDDYRDDAPTFMEVSGLMCFRIHSVYVYLLFYLLFI